MEKTTIGVHTVRKAILVEKNGQTALSMYIPLLILCGQIYLEIA